ncbi:MAG: outer membrane beta-barrel protein [Nitrospirae bacterium]|nr:outer membrane beta-barrel protein [Nitrospirota bacterium]
MSRFAIVLCLSFMSVFLIVLSVRAESPTSSLSIKTGYFIPRIDGWSDHFDEKGVWFGGLELGWKLTRRFELSLNLDYSQTKGKATTPTGRASADEATFQQVPVYASLLYRFIFYEDQPIVPYIGGGFTHQFYRQRLDGDKVSGDQDGYHLRGGLQLLLDYVDPGTAGDFFSEWKVFNTYLTIEAIYSKVDDFGGRDVDLGGWGYVGGLLFEY